MKCCSALPAAGTLKQFPRLNDYQRSVLETSYRNHSLPKAATHKKLAVQIGLSEKKVSQWFTHMRFKARQEKRALGIPSTYTCICIYVQ